MRDLTKVLSDAEAIKLRALIAQMPEPTGSVGGFEEYPKMLYHPDYIALSRVARHHEDLKTRKEAATKMSRVIVVVHDIETEEDYLADGWKSDPVEIMIQMGEADPRTPTGREGRKEGVRKRQSIEDEVKQLRRRYAELTGTRLEPDPVVGAAPPVQPHQATGAGSVRRQQVQQAARKAAQPHARA